MPRRVTRKKRNQRRRKHSRGRGNKKLRGGNPSASYGIQYPPPSINDYISHVLYINLDHRTDRKSQIEKQLEVFSPGKVTRIPGVVNADKARGCTTGHLNAIVYARDHNFPNVLILEDDAMWSSIEVAYPVFEKLVKQPFDVLMLGATYLDYDNSTYKIRKASTASSYLVNSDYYPTIITILQELLNNPQYDTLEGCAKIADCGPYNYLQSKDNWYVVVPSLMIQTPSFSNIQQTHVNYGGVFV